MQSEQLASKISHDLHGPLINIQGFSVEMGNALAEIAALIADHQGSLPADLRDGLSKLIEQDLNPCFAFLHSAVQQLEQRIDSFADAVRAHSRNN